MKIKTNFIRLAAMCAGLAIAAGMLCAAGVHAQMADAQADQAASQDELNQLVAAQDEAIDHRSTFIEKVRNATNGRVIRRAKGSMKRFIMTGRAIQPGRPSNSSGGAMKIRIIC